MSRRFATFVGIVAAASVSAGTPHDDKPVGSAPDIIAELGSRIDSLAVALPALDPVNAKVANDASVLSRIVFDDISFASAVRIVDPSKYPLATNDDAYYGWESIGADIVITGSVDRENGQLVAAIRILSTKDRKVVFETQYTAERATTRELAHYVADSILQKFGIPGMAQTDIAFASDRVDGHKALFFVDYDGHAPRQATRNHHLAFQPRFSPDGSTLSYISYRRKNQPPVLAVANQEPVYAGPGMIFSASWSPDGTEIAFSATRDEPGNAEIYIMRRDGTNIRRLTHHPSIDVSPTWSPTGREIAFTSDRTGSPQIYTMDAEGLSLKRISMKGSYNSEPAWSPAKNFNEIAYASRVSGAVFDIVVHSLQANEIRVLTSNQGLNESPQWSPGGRHLVFTSTRTGSPQIFTMNRDGSNHRQLTFEGENTTPTWRPRKSSR